MKTRKDMEKLIDLFEKIMQQKASHEAFAHEIRNCYEFQSQFANFCKLLLNIQKRLTFEKIKDLLYTFSYDYNTKITIFDGEILKIRQNSSLYPLKIFIIKIKNNYYTTYKSYYNDYYKTRRPSKPIYPINKGNHTELYKSILNNLPISKFEFSNAEKSQINENLKEYSLYTPEPENFELDFSAQTLNQNCSSCPSPGAFRFKCDCVFCKKCLEDLDFLGDCITCENELNSRDHAVIIKIRSSSYSNR